MSRSAPFTSPLTVPAPLGAGGARMGVGGRVPLGSSHPRCPTPASTLKGLSKPVFSVSRSDASPSRHPWVSLGSLHATAVVILGQIRPVAPRPRPVRGRHLAQCPSSCGYFWLLENAALFPSLGISHSLVSWALPPCLLRLLKLNFLITGESRALCDRQEVLLYIQEGRGHASPAGSSWGWYSPTGVCCTNSLSPFRHL